MLHPLAMRGVALALVAVLATLTDDRAPARALMDDRVCVQARAEVRYGALGYDHIAHLSNTCDRAYVCIVRTDVNPSPIEVVVPGLQTVSVVTFRGSPAREFKLYLTCRQR